MNRARKRGGYKAASALRSSSLGRQGVVDVRAMPILARTISSAPWKRMGVRSCWSRWSASAAAAAE
jgi:hypothetical protein